MQKPKSDTTIKPLDQKLIAKLAAVGYEAIPIDVMETLRKLFVRGYAEEQCD